MLEFIRKRATGWVAWFIVILISIPFALWGIQEYMSPVSSLSVAKVNGSEIGLREFQQAFQERRMQLRRLFGPDLSASIDDARVRSETLERLINDELVLQAAATSGLRIGDIQLAEFIHSQETFRADGKFSQLQYENWLRSQGYSPGGFEELMRRDLLSGQFLSGLAASAFATDAELARLQKLHAQRRTFRTLEIPAEGFSDVDVSDEAVAGHYNANKDRFARPEQVTVEYIEISRAEIAEAIPVDESELRRLYESRQANFVTPEQREVSHILISIGMDADKETIDNARVRLIDIQRRIETGIPFEQMAKQHSEDPGTAQNGGALGFIGKGVMDPDFENAAFNLEKGAVSDPVRTRFGWHLVKVTDIRAPRTRSFDEMKEQLRREYQKEQADLVFSERVEQLANLVFEHPESLEIAAETLGVTTQVTQPFSRAGAETGLGANREVVETAFSDDVFTRRNNSGVIELGDGRVVALRIRDHEPSAQRSLSEVREDIVAELKQAAARDAAKRTGETLLGRLRAGEPLHAVGADAGLSWSEPQTAKRREGADPRTRSIVFRMPRPNGNDRPTFHGHQLPNGDFQILALESVSEEALDGAEDSQALRQAFEDAKAAALTAEYVHALRSDAQITINQETLDDRP
jgi:peptidyl-prolyl cis-trans isomerase D